MRKIRNTLANTKEQNRNIITC